MLYHIAKYIVLQDTAAIKISRFDQRDLPDRLFAPSASEQCYACYISFGIRFRISFAIPPITPPVIIPATINTGK